MVVLGLAATGVRGDCFGERVQGFGRFAKTHVRSPGQIVADQLRTREMGRVVSTSKGLGGVPLA